MNAFVTDEDECEHDDRCSQLCVNTFGSFVCACQLGFSLDATGLLCVAETTDAAILSLSLGDFHRGKSTAGKSAPDEKFDWIKSHWTLADWTLAD